MPNNRQEGPTFREVNPWMLDTAAQRLTSQ